MPTLASHNQKSHVTSWCHLQWHHWHVIFTLMLTASYDEELCYTLFELSSPIVKMVLLMIHLASHDSNVGINGIT